jgi:tRNA dimethylallyltransferase
LSSVDTVPALSALVIVGPTASGKSEIACALARRFGGWILSVDSMAVYRGLEIGTSKPGHEIRKEIPHRGLDLVDPDQDFSLGDFLRAADEALAEMRSAGALPILVGGTGLYLRGVLKGVAPLPGRNPEYRRELLEREAAEGPGTLHRLLQERDPDSAGRIAPADTQRLVRALELAEEGVRNALGKPGAEWSAPDRFPSLKLGIRRSRRELALRIQQRVEDFLSRGLLEEVRDLVHRVPAGANAFKALGYRELAAHLRGEKEIARNTLRYAKRQMTWFRREQGVRWFEISGPSARAASEIGDYVEKSRSRFSAVAE